MIRSDIGFILSLILALPAIGMQQKRKKQQYNSKGDQATVSRDDSLFVSFHVLVFFFFGLLLEAFAVVGAK